MEATAVLYYCTTTCKICATVKDWNTCDNVNCCEPKTAQPISKCNSWLKKPHLYLIKLLILKSVKHLCYCSYRPQRDKCPFFIKNSKSFSSKHITIKKGLHTRVASASSSSSSSLCSSISSVTSAFASAISSLRGLLSDISDTNECWTRQEMDWKGARS